MVNFNVNGVTMAFGNFFRDRNWFKKQKTESPPKKKPEDPKMVGLYITPVTIYIWRFLLSGIAASVIISLAMLLSLMLPGPYLFNNWISYPLLVILIVYIGWNEESAGKVIVPMNHVAIVTFLGRRHRIYLTEGEYSWIGRRFFFNISDSPLPNATNVAAGKGEEQGFVYTANRTIQIWQNTENKEITLMLPTRDASTAYINLTLTIQTYDPLDYAATDDPILLVAEKTRSGLRKAGTFFRDVDIAGATNPVVALLRGDKTIAAFISKKVASHLIGTMLHDESGRPIYDVIKAEDKLTSEQEEEVVKKFLNEVVIPKGDPEMLEAMRNKHGEYEVALLEIEDKINEAVEKVGARIVSLELSGAQVSEIVRTVAEKASSEGAQYDLQISSAKTQAEVMQILSKSRKQEGVTELDQLVAASADGNQNIKIIHVTGSSKGNDLTQAAAILADRTNGDKS